MQTQPPAKAETRARRTWLPLLGWTAVVLVLGGDDGSAHATSRIIGPLLRWLLPDAPQATLDQLHFALRKAAHVVEYGVLALLARRALAASGGGSPRRLAVGALLAALAVATLDEGRQAFSATRSGSLGDVALDLTGGVLALSLAIAYTRVMELGRRPRKGA
jgi:VanZ family protein